VTIVTLACELLTWFWILDSAILLTVVNLGPSSRGVCLVLLMDGQFWESLDAASSHAIIFRLFLNSS
jgi:hypothetical protein